MLVRRRADSQGEIVSITQIVNDNIPHEEISVLHDHTFNWLDEHILEWYTIHFTRPARVVKEYGERLAGIIDFTYTEKTTRERATEYVEEMMAQLLMNRSQFDDNLQRIETELGMATDPRRILALRRTKKELQKARMDELSNNKTVVGLQDGSQRTKQAAA